ncbi:hypothetical protein D3C87_2031350 [compost metagenome]
MLLQVVIHIVLAGLLRRLHQIPGFPFIVFLAHVIIQLALGYMVRLNSATLVRFMLRKRMLWRGGGNSSGEHRAGILCGGCLQG